ncbi:D-aminopeptidase [Phyllobacterium endophyticum]|uniref:Aminopeptidase n=1 Tax=Phyllobacterium endophyticum TaxID=1149773 RepID=A0A2P7AKB9_9HYPH|nr:D-aminopeptidase [Phyllobacterium endophyticum]MBB3237117.1 D-aminopeptidase [Phyllobacterium endophyticum]PSH54654.1 aminopeptidase [Phyllobacterium endophyticum]TYR40578.1 D-aminopeptidase [Phyllobacterium endophyticum]
MTPDLERAAEKVAEQFAGPGGTLAVVKGGVVLIKKAWGYANTSEGRCMTAETIFPICSVTKQFTCALLLDLFPDAEVALAERLRAFLPSLGTQRPTIRDLCNNQSGIRDYATLSILAGGAAEATFDRANARAILEQTASLQFAPGTEYCYSNSNFHILASLIEEATGTDFGALLRERLFAPAKMTTAKLVTDSATYPSDCTGYEGNFESGFFAAVNRSHWIGDAGISASLEDLISWERYLQEASKWEGSLYNRIATEQSFIDGTPAPYGYGLAHGLVGNVKVVGHTGGMRGWRIHRTFASDAGVSAIVMFNHEANAKEAAESLIASATGSGNGTDSSAVSRYYVNGSEALLAEVVSDPPHGVMVVAEGDETIICPALANPINETAHLDEDQLEPPMAERRRVFKKLGSAAGKKLEGRFFCPELAATLVVRETSGITYASFHGPLGKSDLFILKSLGEDVWQTPNLRSIDVAPGPLSIMRRISPDGTLVLLVSAPLARNVAFSYIG